MGWGNDDWESEWERMKCREREDRILRVVATILWGVLTGIVLLVLVY